MPTPNAADGHRANGLVRARITGDVAAFDRHGSEAIRLGRSPQLAIALVELTAQLISGLIAKGSITPAAVLTWLDRAESELMAAELKETSGER